VWGEPLREPEPDTVRRAQQGDEEAFEELVRLHMADVYRFARGVVGDATAAEDVVQEAFLKAYRSLPRFRRQAKFSTWLFRITRNCAIDALRRNALQERIRRLAPVETDKPDPSLRTALRSAVADLPTELREVFVLVEIFGYSYPETASILGVPVGTVKSRMHRTRQQLARSLSDEEDADEV
jgi:RNA polymerase sigma-70 factor (ECF subfamily)